jgi:hypothetical protein
MALLFENYDISFSVQNESNGFSTDGLKKVCNE